MNIFKRLRTDENSNEFLRNFSAKQYQMHNVARLRHLESLKLDLSYKRVLEIGAGTGDHTYYYLIKGCDVTATDARPELVNIIQRRFDVTACEINVETELERILAIEKFDIIHCYGLLYHVRNPDTFLRSLKGKCDLLLLETCVSHDFREPEAYLVDENMDNPTQAFSGVGCRPSRKWIELILKETFPFTYFPKTQPEHIEFPKDWRNILEDRERLIRAIFIASTKEIDNNNLSETMPNVYY